MAVVSGEGWATPFDRNGESYAMTGNRVPVLRSFYLAYDIGDPTPGDHEILAMGVMVGGASQDLSPNVNFPPAAIPDGRLEVALQDADATGENSSTKSPLNPKSACRAALSDQAGQQCRKSG